MNASAPENGGRQPGAQDRARLVVDARGVVVEWSPAAQRLLGHPAARVVGRPVTELLAGATDGAGDTGDVGLRHRDGHAVGCRVRVRAEAAGTADGPRWTVELTAAGTGPDPAIDGALLDALFTRSPVGLFVLDPQLRLLRFNAAAEGMRGTSIQQTLGHRTIEAWPEFGGETAEQVMSRVLETGEPVIGFEKRGRPPGDPEHEHIYSTSLFRLHDDEGRVLGIADTAIDVTERRRAQEHLALVAEAGERVGTTLDVLRTAQELAEVMVPRLADSVAVDVLEPVLGGDEIPSGPAEPGVELLRAASRSRRTDGTAGAYPAAEAGSCPVGASALRALADHQPRLVRPVAGDGALVHSDPARDCAEPEDGVHSLMLVPLVARDSVLGLVTCRRRRGDAPFEEADLVLAVDLAGRAAVALDNARRYVRERNAVLALQRGLLPRRLPAPSAVVAAHHLVHSGAGGDWAEVIPLPGARAALVVGSAPGRGLRTVATMGRLRAAVHTLAALDLAPDEVLARLDEVVRHLSRDGSDGGADTGGGQACGARAGEAGATCLYVVYDPVTRRCTMATAGGPGPAVLRPDGTVDLPELPVGPPLGCTGPLFGKAEVTLPEGSLLVLHTPGLLQTRRDGTGRGELVRQLTRPDAARDPDELCVALAEALLPEDAGDDAAVLVARTRVLGSSQVAAWELPADPAAVATARLLATRQLSVWALDEEVFTTELIVSELVTNSVKYAGAPITLRLIRDRTLTCEVSDGSSTAPHLRHARTTDEGGRGLALVGHVAQRWGTRATDRGKTIWAEQPIGAEAPLPEAAPVPL
ncbi:SpoIIE family protein phosphatase [Streptacidiphilus griseoplanus]|uniref:SpoIIE family protein phosphatase n=1 Tax=Peterkaempfera griseoplana TaxID=66896 RepID=UPI0007C78B1B|nr:SpoIIE family protein phosphatase [Peterkaempfera griseoplana]